MMTEKCETRLANALKAPFVSRRVRRFTLRTALALALLLALLCGAALAVVNWGTRDMLRVPDGNNGFAPNASLDAYIQPVGQTFEGDALRVEVIDALYDGKALALAWTVENKLNVPVYLICERTDVNGAPLGQGALYGVDELFVQPGEVRRCGFVRQVADDALTGDCAVRLRYIALLPTGDVVRADSQGIEENDTAYQARVDALIAQGKVVIAPDGVIELSSGYQSRTEDTYARQLVNAGLMTDAGALEVALTLRRTGEALSGLAFGQPMEADMNGYTLRVTACQLTPLVTFIDMECVFHTAQAYERFRPSEGKLAPRWYFTVLADGEQYWHNHESAAFQGVPEARDDGSVVWRYVYYAMEPHFTPKTLTIMPRYDGGDAYAAPGPEESLTLTVR